MRVHDSRATRWQIIGNVAQWAENIRARIAEKKSHYKCSKSFPALVVFDFIIERQNPGYIAAYMGQVRRQREGVRHRGIEFDPLAINSELVAEGFWILPVHVDPRALCIPVTYEVSSISNAETSRQLVVQAVFECTCSTKPTTNRIRNCGR